MSHTFRRDKQWLIHHRVGSFVEYLEAEIRFERDYLGVPEIELLAPKQIDAIYRKYIHQITRFVNDGRCSKYGAPRWYRHYYGSVKFRSQERQREHNAQKYDEWDQHVHPKFPRDAAWYFW